jgi:hypothetical protein
MSRAALDLSVLPKTGQRNSLTWLDVRLGSPIGSTDNHRLQIIENPADPDCKIGSAGFFVLYEKEVVTNECQTDQHSTTLTASPPRDVSL